MAVSAWLLFGVSAALSVVPGPAVEAPHPASPPQPPQTVQCTLHIVGPSRVVFVYSGSPASLLGVSNFVPSEGTFVLRTSEYVEHMRRIRHIAVYAVDGVVPSVQGSRFGARLLSYASEPLDD